MSTKIIQIDVIEHRVTEETKHIKKGSKQKKSPKLTPEERQQNKEEREHAAAQRAKQKVIRSNIVYASMAVRKTTQVVGEIAGIAIDQSFTRQIFNAKMLGDTRKSQILQNKKNQTKATNAFITTSVNNAASAIAGAAINPILGIIQVVTYVSQLGVKILDQMMTYQENMREYQLENERQIAQSEYIRKRLLKNTFTNRGVF